MILNIFIGLMISSSYRIASEVGPTRHAVTAPQCVIASSNSLDLWPDLSMGSNKAGMKDWESASTAPKVLAREFPEFVVVEFEPNRVAACSYVEDITD